jgi:hypothetical protein
MAAKVAKIDNVGGPPTSLGEDKEGQVQTLLKEVLHKVSKCSLCCLQLHDSSSFCQGSLLGWMLKGIKERLTLAST